MELFNKQLRGYLEKKNELVKDGRKLSAKIEILNIKLEKNKEKQRKYTAEIEPKELIEKGNALSKQIENALTNLEEIQKEVHAMKIKNIPESVGNEYESIKKDIEELEIERNKKALGIQKLKDRIVPLTQKLVGNALSEFEDLETVELKGEKIIVTVFSHLDDFTRKFREGKKK